MIGFLSSILIVVGICFFILFLYSLSKKRNSLSAPYSVMCLAITIYIVGYGLELRADSIEEIIFFLKLEYFGAPFMSAFWMIFAYKFHFNKAPSIKTSLLILFLPVLTLFFSGTNEYHHLLYKEVSAFEHEGYLLAQLSRGPWYYVNIGYAYLIQLLVMVIFFKAWRKVGHKYGTQAFWLFSGSLWPSIINLFYVLGLSPLNLDLTPFGLTFSAIFFYLAIFSYDFLEFKEIVKDVTFVEINEGIIVIDDKQRLIDFNKAAKKIFHWLDPRYIGTQISNFKEGKEILNQSNNQFEIQIVENSISRFLEVRKTQLKEKDTLVGYVYFMQDITEQKAMIEALNEMANFDSLTQVYNRRRLLEEAEKALKRCKRYGHVISALMIDVDHFKVINDKYGHQVGDEVLKTISKVLVDRIRCTDIIGRYGGEEFLIILPEASKYDAFKVALDIKEYISNMVIVINDEIIKATISIGIETGKVSDEELTVDMLIYNADMALYKAKNSGRNKICTYEMHTAPINY